MDSSITIKSFYSIQFVLSVIQLIPALTEGSVLPLSRDDLRKKYGQGIFNVDNVNKIKLKTLFNFLILADTIFNDGKSCNRVCDGRPMTCYYEFNIKKYDTMCG